MLPFFDDEFQVNEPVTGTKSFTQRATAVLPDGRIVVVWSGDGQTGDGDPSQSGNGIRGCILNADGSQSGNEFIVNSTRLNDQYDPAIAMLTDGRFVVTWASNDPGDGGTIEQDACIRARVFDANGKPALYNGSKADFVVNTNPGFHQYAPEVEALDNGGFVITFSGAAVENGFANHDIGMRVFTSTGPAGPEVIISGASSHNPGSTSMTRLDDGRYVVAWTVSQDTSNVVARIFNEDGTPASLAFNLASITQGAQQQVHIATLSDGRFIAAWTGEESNGSTGASDGSATGIRARIFNADGTPDLTVNGGEEFPVNTTTESDQRRANILALEDGRFLITFWSRHDPVSGTSKNMILGRLFNADGTPQGSDFVINEGAAMSGGASTGTPHEYVQTLDGRILAIYANEPGIEAGAIIGRFLDPSTGPANYMGTSGSDQFGGTRFNDVLTGLGGRDVLAGGLGNDKIKGGDGNDRLAGGGGDDVLSGGTGNDVLLGGQGRDVLRGNNGADVLKGGAGNDTLEGGKGADTFAFDSLAAGTDTINDFDLALDKIDVSGIDAQEAVPGHQDFLFVGTGPFTGAGQIRLEQKGNVVVVHIDTDGDPGSELRFRILNVDADDMNVGHFILV